MSPSIAGKSKEMIRKFLGVFTNPKELLPYNTNLAATIRTNSSVPIYSILYPYPIGVADFLNNKIKDLLHNDIIRPSSSPYNNPDWVVDKKGKDEYSNT